MRLMCASHFKVVKTTPIATKSEKDIYIYILFIEIMLKCMGSIVFNIIKHNSCYIKTFQLQLLMKKLHLPLARKKAFH